MSAVERRRVRQAVDVAARAAIACGSGTPHLREGLVRGSAAPSLPQMQKRQPSVLLALRQYDGGRVS